MTTTIPTLNPWRKEREVPLYLFHANAFPQMARRYCVHTPERELVLTGRLTPLQVGRDRFYDWRELMALTPEWAKSKPIAALMDRVTKVAAR